MAFVCTALFLKLRGKNTSRDDADILKIYKMGILVMTALCGKNRVFSKTKKKNTSSTLTALVNSLCAKRKWVLDQNLSDMKEYSMSWGPAFYVVHDDLLLPGEQLVIWRRFYRGVVSRHIASQSWFSLLSWTES